MSGSCDLIIGDAAIGLVTEGYGLMSGYAATSFQLAQDGLSKLYNFSVTPVAFDVSWNLNPDIQGYVRPIAPADIAAAYDPKAISDPGNAPDTSFNQITFTNAPVNTAVEPSINIDNGPGALTAVAPGAAPSLSAVVVPTAPTVALPSAPTLYSLNLPAAPAVTIPTFTGTRPVLNFDAPVQSWSFTAQDYSDTLLDSTKAQIAFGLLGGTGLPIAIEQAMYDRSNSRQDVSEIRAIQEAMEERSAKGWSEPDGILTYRIQEVRQNSANARAGFNRDVLLEIAKIDIENMKFYVQQGVALESKLIDLHLETQRLILEANKFVMQSAIELFNAKVSLFNAEQQAYATDAQVFRDKLQACLTQIEIYKAEIDAQKLVGEINQQLVSIYESNIRAVLASVEIYKAQVEGATAQAEANRVVIEAYRATVEAYGENVRAYEAQWRGYAAQVEAQVSKEKIYQISTDAYATNVHAWAEKNTSLIEQQKLVLGEKDLDVRVFQAKIEKFKAQYEAEAARIRALVEIYGSRVDLYRGEAGVEEAAAAANARAANLQIENNRSATEVALKNADLQINQLEKNAALILEQLKGITSTAAQLCASSFTALHFSAQASHSASNGQECSTVYQVNQ